MLVPETAAEEREGHGRRVFVPETAAEEREGHGRLEKGAVDHPDEGQPEHTGNTSTARSQLLN